MKIRQGFVSNSSSSSFIVKGKDGFKCVLDIEYGDSIESIENMVAKLNGKYNLDLIFKSEEDNY